MSGLFFQVSNQRDSTLSQLNVIFSWDFSDQVLTVETTNEMPALICRCLQALAEALKINASVTNFKLARNQIGDEGAKAWCGGHVMMSCFHMFSTSFDRKKFGCFGDAVVLWFISDRVELSANMRMLNIAE